MEQQLNETEQYAEDMRIQDENNAWQQEVETSSKAIELFEKGLTKTDLKIMSVNAVDNVLEKGNVLQVVEALSAMELFIKEVKEDKRFKDYVREEVAKEKTFTSKAGAKIEIAETGTKYDFSLCNDVALAELELDLIEIETKVKARKDFLKTIPVSGLEILQHDELIKIYPPTKTSTSSYKITLAK